MSKEERQPKSIESRPPLTADEKKIIALLQGDIPVDRRPFLEIAQEIGVEEEVVLETLQRLSKEGIIRRFGVTIRHQISGFKANAMGAWQVDESRINDVGKMMAAFEEIRGDKKGNIEPLELK